MFTKRSVLVGLGVLFIARLVSAAALQGAPDPRHNWYVLGDNLAIRAQNPGLNTAIMSNTGLGNEFYFAAVESTQGDPLEIAIVSTDYLNATGFLTKFSIDPANVWNTQVTTCDLNGAPGSEYGYAADILPGAYGAETTRAVAAVTAPANDSVHWVGTPASGSGPCIDLGSVSDTLTYTAYGVNVEVTEEPSAPYMLVNAWGTSANPSGADGSLHMYSYNFTGSEVQTTLLGKIQGTQLFDFVPVELDSLCGVPTANDCVFVVGRPWNSPDPPTVSSIGIITGSPVVLSNFEAPGAAGFGSAVAVIGDVNGDNKPDVVVASDEGAHVVSGGKFGIPGGATFTDTLYVVPAPVAGGGFPEAFLVDVDVNGDGTPDWGASAFDADPQGKMDAGIVYLFDGATGAVIYEIHGQQVGEELGGTAKGLFSLGDLAPFDNRSEFAIVAPWHEAKFSMPGTIIAHTGDILFNASQPPVNFKPFKSLLLDPIEELRAKLGWPSSK